MAALIEPFDNLQDESSVPIARSPKRIKAFIVCNPGLAGRFYAIELYRYRPMFTVAYPKTTLAGLYSAFQHWELLSVLSPKSIAHFIRKNRSGSSI